MKKVSILALHLGYGGVEKCIVSLANMLASKYEVEIACCYRLYDECVFELDPKVKIKYLNKKDIVPNHDAIRSAFKSKNPIKIIKEGLYGLKVLYFRKRKMIEYIKNKRCNVIVSTRDIFNYWVSSYARDGIIKIGWEHNHFHDNYKYALNVVNSAKKLDYLVLVSSELQRYYSKELINSKCMSLFIPNCIDKIPSRIAPLKEKRLICVGRLSKEKGHLDLLKVYNKVYKNHPDWILDIIGDGSERERLEKYIESHNLENNVVLHGFQSKDYIDKMLHNSSIYLMTSYTESFGIVLIEAMSHGVPCIAYDSAEGAREIISSGKNGFLIKHRNSDAMSMIINTLIEKEEERIRIGKLARESVKEYASDVICEEWYTLIEESDVYE